MPRYIVMKNGIRISSVVATGNLKALCDFLSIEGFPKFPMHTHQGLLLAKVGNDIYMTFDCTDVNANGIATSIINQNNVRTLKHKISARLNKLMTLPTLNVEAAHHVV